MAWVDYIVSGLPETLSPGRIGRALFQSTGLRSDAIGCMTPVGPGAVSVEVSALAALSLRTPMTLPVQEKRFSTLWTLSHPNDPATLPAVGQIIVRWDDGGQVPAPGALGEALAQAIGAHLGVDDLGVGLLAHNALHISVPLAWTWADNWPTQLTVEGQQLEIYRPAAQVGAEKKKA